MSTNAVPQPGNAHVKQLESVTSLFDDVLRSYGITGAQVAALIAVILGSVGLQDYFNPGAWTIVAILCLVMVYIFRRQVPDKLGITGIGAVGFLIAFTFGLLYWYRLSAFREPKDFLMHYHVPLTALLSFATTTVVACIVTSYQAQELVRGLVYPKSIDDVIQKHFYAYAFYRSDVKYEIEVKSIDAEKQVVTFQTVMTYSITNRTKNPMPYAMRFPFGRENGKAIELNLDDTTLDVTAKTYQMQNGIQVNDTILPRQTRKVRFTVQETFRMFDSEMYITRDPATELRLTLTNSFQELRFEHEFLYFEEPLHPKSQKKIELCITGGVLPYQGIKLMWEPARRIQ